MSGDEQAIHVVIELELDGASIEGTLHDQRGDCHVFSGLLGLFAALETVRAYRAAHGDQGAAT